MIKNLFKTIRTFLASMNVTYSSVLDDYAINLNKLAKENKIDPVWGRKKELQRVTQILLKRTKNNPIILGEPGVGKTALVEELARSIVNNTCHHDLSDKEIYMLDLAAIVAGTHERGEAETRLTKLIEELRERENVILMIDEIHILGSGSDSSKKASANMNVSSTIANILKPGLARGEIVCIGATTHDEYIKYFVNDKAMERRFQTVILNEPTMEETRDILDLAKSRYEEFHKCVIHADALDKCVQLSDRYIHYRNFPDKALDLLDETCSKVLIEYQKELRTDKDITREDVEKVLKAIMDVPLTLENVGSRIHTLDSDLRSQILGQEEAVSTVVRTMKLHTCGFNDKNKPIASLFFVGPTGTGKTELVNVLADNYFGSRERNIIRFDMSEFMDESSISGLLGAPPGYVGFEDSGKLVKAIKQNPYSIVLFDEIEKAHPKICNTLLHVLENGLMDDNKGNTVSFRNAIIVFTSNVGFTHSKHKQLGFETENTCDRNLKPVCTYDRDNLTTQLKYTFKPEFLNRIDAIVPFEYLSDEAIVKIADKLINDALDIVSQKYGFRPVVSNDTRKQIYEHGKGTSYGARPLRNAVSKLIMDVLSEKVLKQYEESSDKGFNKAWMVI